MMLLTVLIVHLRLLDISMLEGICNKCVFILNSVICVHYTVSQPGVDPGRLEGVEL